MRDRPAGSTNLHDRFVPWKSSRVYWDFPQWLGRERHGTLTRRVSNLGFSQKVMSCGKRKSEIRCEEPRRKRGRHVSSEPRRSDGNQKVTRSYQRTTDTSKNHRHRREDHHRLNLRTGILASRRLRSPLRRKIMAGLPNLLSAIPRNRYGMSSFILPPDVEDLKDYGFRVR